VREKLSVGCGRQTGVGGSGVGNRLALTAVIPVMAGIRPVGLHHKGWLRRACHEAGGRRGHRTVTTATDSDNLRLGIGESRRGVLRTRPRHTIQKCVGKTPLSSRPCVFCRPQILPMRARFVITLREYRRSASEIPEKRAYPLGSQRSPWP
jgi:hypothetical protein